MTSWKLFWCDLETTGLEPDDYAPLEVGCFITDIALNIISPTRNWVINPGRNAIAEMHPEARKMHEDSGLLAEVRSAALTDTEMVLDPEILAFINEHTFPEDKVVLAGATCHFDRTWLKEWFPLVLARLHYRHVDVSMFKVLLDKEPTKHHRALGDLASAIEFFRPLLRHMRSYE